ncbi:GAF and ANTAR domain-containing protein [Pseudonocardia zijingensis]|uniref:GAF and ANTAR domain-containing protein n=1 Tax=Pseudonocardia zijingensis TaxID=153376 RepID=UPI0031CE99E2
MGEHVGVMLAAMIVETSSLDELLVGIAELAAGAVKGAVSASMALTAPGWSRRVIASEERAIRLETLQRRHGQGPGPDALRTARPVDVPDVRIDLRWPVFAGAAAEAGLLAVRSVPMIVADGAPVGVLTVYGAGARSFDGGAGSFVDRIAGYATLAVVGTMRDYDHTGLLARLRRALASQAIVDQAVGVVMAQRSCSAEAALDVLRTRAIERATSVQAVAEDVVARAEEAARSRGQDG